MAETQAFYDALFEEPANPAEAQRLIEEGEVKADDSIDYTGVLLWAVGSGHLGVIRAICIKAPKGSFAMACDWARSLHKAVERSDVEILKILLEYCPKTSVRQQRELLDAAVADPEMLRLLLEKAGHGWRLDNISTIRDIMSRGDIAVLKILDEWDCINYRELGGSICIGKGDASECGKFLKVRGPKTDDGFDVLVDCCVFSEGTGATRACCRTQQGEGCGYQGEEAQGEEEIEVKQTLEGNRTMPVDTDCGGGMLPRFVHGCRTSASMRGLGPSEEKGMFP